MLTPFTVGLAERVRLDGEPAVGPLVLRSPYRQLRLVAPEPAAAAVLGALAEDGATEAELLRLADGADGLPQVYYLLGRLAAAGFLRYSVAAHGRPLAVAEPLTAGFRLLAVAVAPDQP